MSSSFASALFWCFHVLTSDAKIVFLKSPINTWVYIGLYWDNGNHMETTIMGYFQFFHSGSC